MPRIRIIVVAVIVHFFLLQTVLEAWDNERTHRDLSEISTRKSTLGTQAYLKNIGFSLGLDEKINGKEVFVWLRDGAFLEDEGSNWQGFTGAARYTNHFHNPLKPWSAAGLTDLQSGESSVLWAQDSNKQLTSVGGDWSWQATRDYFYKALTLTTDAERQETFAKTFRGLGHQMHLIQDMSVPAHVRNDAHPEDAILGSNYLTGDLYFETWAKKNKGLINSFASAPAFSAVDLNINHYSLAPISQFIDTEQYNENVVPSKSLNWGLSEYTSSNFVSTDTVFTENFSTSDGHYFPYPRYVDQNQCYEQYEEAYGFENKKRTYWRKKCLGEPVDHFVAEGPLFKYLPTWDLQRLTLKLDGSTHNDYAQKLIPRAVGYSAGLLNYFFRGDIDMIPDDATGSGYVIVNNSDEDMNGTFELYYDNKSEQRVKAWSGSYSIGKKSSGNNKSTNITFILPSDVKDSGEHILVFRGRLGNEEDAVVGRKVNLAKDFLFFVKAFPVWTNVGNGWMDVWKTLVFEIKTANNQYQLEPVSKNINFAVWNSPSSLLTVQSNPDQKEHMVALPSRGNRTYEPNIAKYGDEVYYFTDYLGYDHYFAIGFPQAYIPKNFNDNQSPYIWDSSFQFGDWVYCTGYYCGYYDKPRIASFIHGRRPFSVSNNKLIAKNINMRRNESYTYSSSSDYTGPFHIQWKDESGKWVRGMDLPDAGGDHIYKRVVPNYNCTTEYVSDGWIYTCGMLADKVTQSQKPIPIDYIAVLDQERTIHTKTDISDISQYSLGNNGELKSVVTTTYEYYNNWCNRTYAIKKDWSATYKNIGTNSTYSKKSKLVIGDTILKEFENNDMWEGRDIRYFGGKDTSTKISDSNPNCYLYQGNSKVESINKAISISGDTTTVIIRGKPYQSLVRNSSSESNGRTFTKIMDYDHIEGDKHYILFYEYQDKNSQSSAKYMSNRGVYGTGEDARIINSDQGLAELIQSFGQDGYPSHDQKQTSITKAGYVLAYKINGVLNKIDLGINSTDTYTLTSGWDNLNILSDGYSYTVGSTYTQYKTTEGKRLTGVSSQINDTNMVYTYIVERYDNNKWVFDKRIVGIINISDSALPVDYRQEFEITDANAAGFLTDMYKDYNYKDLAALGVHREIK